MLTAYPLSALFALKVQLVQITVIIPTISEAAVLFVKQLMCIHPH